ncbi:MAG: 2-amino-4-hydroxy-6-hydroxymethyldihydropteridine diphosphokinase [Gemmatimonadaceae bacterium]|nr:2-amino-4-hydroxy-6-hydroxymethyldihydropteridine diphosphokinase [Gemmatimonadaceae bacterium]
MYLNQMALVETSRSLDTLLDALQEIERTHGRARLVAKGPRTLDLDIVYATTVTITSDRLLVPHPGLLDRPFWQRELAQLIGDEAASMAIAAAQVHAGMDTAGRVDARVRLRASGHTETAA